MRQPKPPEVNLEEKIILRSNKNPFYRFFYLFATSKILSLVITLSIVVNTVVIFSEKHPQTEEQ